MKKWLFKTLILLLSGGGLALPVSAQEMITIEQCQKWAMENYPLIRQHGLIDRARDYTISNISRKYLPEFSLTGSASWMSQGTEIELELPETLNVELDLPGIPKTTIPIDMPEIKLPETGKDRYNVGASVQQVLWDGGRIAAGKNMARTEAAMMHEGLDAQLYAIKSKVKEIFFGILVLDGRLEQLDKADEILNSIRTRAEVALKEGVVYPTDLDAVDVERLKYKQQRVQLDALREGCLKMLSRFIHRPVTSSALLQVPERKALPEGEEIRRPELKYLNKKKERLDADLRMLNAENMPKIGLFAGGGYGKPGLNMFDDSFSLYAAGGVMLSWNFGKLYTLKNDRKIIKLQQEGIGMEQESFIFNTRMELVQQDMEVKRLLKLIEDDAEIVRLRENIMKASEVKYENGVYTISELIMDVNYARIAQQEKLLRELELKMVLYTREIVAGK